MSIYRIHHHRMTESGLVHPGAVHLVNLFITTNLPNQTIELWCAPGPPSGECYTRIVKREKDTDVYSFTVPLEYPRGLYIVMSPGVEEVTLCIKHAGE
jgi:hypothetical protein